MLRTFHLLVKRFSQGEKPLSASQIAHKLEIPVRLVRQLLYELTGAGLVVETVRGIDHEAAFQPGRTIEDITVKYTLEMYERLGNTQLPIAQEEEKISMVLKHISETIETSPGNVKLKEIG